MELTLEALAIVEFGRFRMLPHRRELLADGQPIKLGGRAFDVLMALIEARGAVVEQGRADGARLAGPGRRRERPAGPDFGVAHGFRCGARADPDGLRTRLPVHRRDPHPGGQPRMSVPVPG